jgi:hypothetical protein
MCPVRSVAGDVLKRCQFLSLTELNMVTKRECVPPGFLRSRHTCGIKCVSISLGEMPKKMKTGFLLLTLKQ